MSAPETVGYVIGVSAALVGGCLKLWRVQDRRAARRLLASMPQQRGVDRMLGQRALLAAVRTPAKPFVPAQRTAVER